MSRGSAASSGERRARSRSTSASASSPDHDAIIIHEAVRPLVTVDEFRALIAAPDANAMFGIPIPFTVLKGHDYVEDLLERDELVNVQLPQKFDRAKLVAAHEAARREGTSFTEDASLFHHHTGEPVRILPGLRAQHQDHRPDRHRDRRGDLRRRHRPRGLTVGKVCVITGASQGIGRAAAIRMSQEPDISALVLIARNADGLAETGAALEREGKDVELIPYDLMDLDGIPELVERIHGRYGSIDILLNIAGYADPQSLLDTSSDNIVKTYTINVFAMLLLIREVTRHMYDRPAKILNVASTAGITSRPGWLAYASSKAAVVSMSATLADELAGSGIKVYSISPGRTATELRRKLAPEEDPSSIMQPGDVADVIAQLMSDAEKTLDGQNIVVRTRA